ncbi:hypothetical protein PYW07_013330 [Mythimna separata]|uniref:Uncharacterized protein n=1 Tax=Mythimna separata TaxID=271217 RepID=A0AAD8DKC2_MYTSE|nr:hypothetical protein PYW07_013324 [Mythimna separata]KAJ8704036.1 hypothetical protein PYW07_013330 [Mythimna separata]
MDQIIRQTLTSILNVAMDDRAWSQATLPIRIGGLGIRKISSISLPAFVSSVHGTEKLIRNVLSSSLINFNVPCFTEAIYTWRLTCPNSNPPDDPSSQRRWDEPLCRVVQENLIALSTTPAERARLLAVGEWESGLWLHALPSSNLGTLLDDTTFRLAASLRLGAPC